jgi:hypothetical protein
MLTYVRYVFNTCSGLPTINMYVSNLAMETSGHRQVHEDVVVDVVAEAAKPKVRRINI